MSAQPQETPAAPLAVSVASASATLTVESVIERVSLVHRLLREVMQSDVHYGKIPGCDDKPTLLQPGAQKLCMLFRLNPTVLIEDRNDLPDLHREYSTTIRLISEASGDPVAEGVGCCSTMEAKYRFRTGPKKDTGEPVPPEYWNKKKADPKGAQALLGGQGFVVGKDGSGQWTIHARGAKVEHDNPADYYNTVRKMAFKRAYVHATINATAASDIFTQDIEESPELYARGGSGGRAAPSSGQPQEPPRRPQATAPSQWERDATPAAPANGGNGGTVRLISEPQRKRLYAITMQGPHDVDHIKAHMLERYGVGSTKEIPFDLYEEICDYAAGNAPAPAAGAQPEPGYNG